MNESVPPTSYQFPQNDSEPPNSYGTFFDSFFNFYNPIHTPLTITICVFGTFANTINIIVLTRKEMLGPTNLLLTGLSLAQLGLVVDYLFLLTYDALSFHCLPGWHSFGWTFFKLINVNLNIVFHTIALTHTVLLAVFRFIAVSMPTKARHFVNMQTARLSISCIYLVVPIVCLPVFFSTVIKSRPVDETEQIYNCSRRHEQLFDLLFADNEILMQIPIWMFGTIFKLIPCVVISVFSYMLAGTLKKVEQRKQALQGSQLDRKRSQRNRITMMLMIIVMLFVAVEFPQGVLCFLVGILGEQFAYKVYNNVGSFFEMLTILYSSVNFVLYCTMSSQFQTTFKEIICVCLPQQPSQGQYMNMDTITIANTNAGGTPTTKTVVNEQQTLLRNGIPPLRSSKVSYATNF